MSKKHNGHAEKTSTHPFEETIKKTSYQALRYAKKHPTQILGLALVAGVTLIKLLRSRK